MAAVTTVQAEERRQRKMLIILFSVFFVGLGYVVYDYFRIVNTRVLPEKTDQYDTIVDKWKSEGLVKSLDVRGAVLVVNEAQWQNQGRSQKIGIVTQLARYCAEKKQSQSWVLQVVSASNGNIVAEMGNTGLRIM